MTGHLIPELLEEYVIDACSVLNFWIINDDEPFGMDVHQSAWNYLEQQIEAGRIIAPLQVRAEILKHGPPEIKEWVQAHEGMFVPPQVEQIEPLTKITKEFPVYKTTNGSEADAAVSALAAARALCVITSEKFEEIPTKLTKNPKIPNVCDKFDIDWVSVNGFYRREKVKF